MHNYHFSFAPIRISMYYVNIITVITFISAVLFSSYTKAQNVGFSKDEFLISGNIGFNANKEDGTKSTSYQFTLAPSIMVSKKIATGIYFGTSNQKDISDNFSFGIQMAYYHSPKNKFSLYGKLNAGYFEQSENGSKGHGYSFSFSPGINYFISDRLAIQSGLAMIGFDTFKERKSSEVKTFSFGADFTQINFGIILRNP